MSDELPKGWAEIDLPEIASLNMGQSPPSDTYNTKRRGLPFFQGKTEFGDLYPTPEKFCSAPNKIAEADDILISVRAPVGPTNLCRERSCIGRGLAAIRPRGEIPVRYLLFYLRSIEAWLATQGTGSTFTAISKSDLEQLRVRLAPLAEQQRIVAKLETLLGQVDACQQRLEKLPTLLKRFRQSVLAAACSGRLTADWREENNNIQAADSLIKKAQFQIAGPENELSELPEKWQWVALGNYVHCFRGRFSPRPRNDPRYFNGRHPFIQIGNLPREGGLVNSHVQTLNDEGLAVSRKFPKGTVVIAIVGATIGNTGVLAYDMCVTDSIVGLETGDKLGNRYVELFLRHKKDDIRQTSYSSGGQPNINLATLNPYPLALPPLPEQKEIVRRTESLFALADQLELRLAKAQKQVDALTPSLLARAFAGKLVAQNPKDEPAAKLLTRIQAKY